MTPQPCQQLPAKARKSMCRRCCILVDSFNNTTETKNRLTSVNCVAKGKVFTQVNSGRVQLTLTHVSTSYREGIYPSKLAIGRVFTQVN